MEIHPFDEKIYSIFDKDQDLQAIVSGFEFIEGPIWHSEDKNLTFSDIPASKIYRWSEKGGLQVLCDKANKPNGNVYVDSQNNIITCEHATSSLVIRNKLGENRRVLVSHYQGKELNSPNDVIVGKNGDVLFTDPYFGRNPGRVGVARERQLGFQGIYRYELDIHRLTLLSDEFENPNGLCFSNDERLLYVADSPRKHIKVFEWKNNQLVNGKILAEIDFLGSGLPDGLKVDSQGNIYCCAQGGLHIFDKKGMKLGLLKMPEQTANFNWGDESQMSIYLAASTTLYRVKTKIPGPITLNSTDGLNTTDEIKIDC